MDVLLSKINWTKNVFYRISKKFFSRIREVDAFRDKEKQQKLP